VRTVLVNRLVFTPVPRPAQLSPPKGPGRKPRFVYELRGEGSLSKLFAGLVSASSVVAPYLKALPPSMGRSAVRHRATSPCGATLPLHGMVSRGPLSHPLFIRPLGV